LVAGLSRGHQELGQEAIHMPAKINDSGSQELHHVTAVH
jgi:hypothetical protein